MCINKAKYSGTNNSFIFKLTIFHDICIKTYISQKILLKVFLIILINLTLDYYYSNTSISTDVIFDEVCESIQTYFDEVDYKRSVLSK